MGTLNPNVDLLYIEDNEDFVDFVGITVKKIDANVTYDYITDGLSAKEYIEKLAVKNSQVAAKVILMDYNLPGMNGIQLLKHIRSFSSIKHIPVVIFSSSDNPVDIKSAYDSGANAYLVKPVGLASLRDTMQSICTFWIHKNQRA